VYRPAFTDKGEYFNEDGKVGSRCYRKGWGKFLNDDSTFRRTGMKPDKGGLRKFSNQLLHTGGLRIVHHYETSAGNVEGYLDRVGKLVEEGGGGRRRGGRVEKEPLSIRGI